MKFFKKMIRRRFKCNNREMIKGDLMQVVMTDSDDNGLNFDVRNISLCGANTVDDLIIGDCFIIIENVEARNEGLVGRYLGVGDYTLLTRNSMKVEYKYSDKDENESFEAVKHLIKKSFIITPNIYEWNGQIFCYSESINRWDKMIIRKQTINGKEIREIICI